MFSETVEPVLSSQLFWQEKKSGPKRHVLALLEGQEVSPVIKTIS